MGTFGNPIVGSLGRLIREAIVSANFVSGVMGWRVAQDGTAEFNDVAVRGSVTADNGNIVLDSDGLYIDANGGYIELTEYGIGYYNDSGSYAELTANQFSEDSYISIRPGDEPGIDWDPAELYAGGDSGGAFLSVSSPQPAFPDPAQAATLMLSSSEPGVADGSRAWIIADRTSMQGDAGVGGDLDVGSTVRVGEVAGSLTDLGRGLWALAWSSSTGPTMTGGAAENVQLTVASTTYKAGRAYEVRHLAMGRLSAVVANAILYFRFRKSTATTGQLLVELGRAPMVQTLQTGVYQAGVFTVGASDVTATLVLCGQAPTGANGTHEAPAGQRRRIEIHDVGEASAYPFAEVLV